MLKGLQLESIPIIGGSQNLGNELRSDAIVRFEEVYTKLCSEKDLPLLVFDTCSHTGGTIKSACDLLTSAGFTDVQVVTAEAPDPWSGVVTAAKIDRKRKEDGCYPFGYYTESLVQKGADIVSVRDPKAARSGAQVRREIRQIMRDYSGSTS
jgi:hypothetical protein